MSHWADDKRSMQLIFLLVEFNIISWKDRHKLAEYWSKAHGSKVSIGN